MPSKQARDPANPIRNSPYEEAESHDATDQDGMDEERVNLLAFMRAQEGSMRRFWKETERDGL